ncbi:hypothetical protein [Paraburkholderia sp. SG-MS1]|uniref:hypothetical protein n=1 Tax=Paraburkholderia sp. SG-MS1 TaxID=2023741 RepID=UPI0014452228|nr:hypothetical protein [Paraburkholderia sp. SG-MS1]
MIGNPKKIDASGAHMADCGACLDRAILGKDRQTGCQELSMPSGCFTDYWSIKIPVFIIRQWLIIIRGKLAKSVLLAIANFYNYS